MDAESKAAGLGGEIKPTVTPPTATAPSEPFATFPTKELFDDRVERATKSAVKKVLGVDLEDAKARLARLAELEAAEEERKKAAMTEAERNKAEIDKLRAEAEAARAEAARAMSEAQAARVFARHGVRDDEYGTWKLRQAEAAAKLAGTEFSADAFVAELLKDPRERVKLGVDDVGTAAKQASSPAATTHGSGAQPQPPAAGSVTQQKDAMQMTPDEFRRHLASLGVG
jgi:hypothetical protein